MSIHLRDKEIDDFVSGLASEKEAEKIREHISSCPRCGKVVTALASVVAEEQPVSLPGEHVRKAVMAQWFMLHNQAAGKGAPQRSLFNRFNAGLAAAASVILIIGAYIFSGVIKPDEGYPLIISSASGDVQINDSQASHGTIINAGDILKTGTDGRVFLSAEKYNLHIGGSSSIAVASNTRRTGIRFILDEGSVISRSAGDMPYSFRCGKFDVTPSGTEFMLKYSVNRLHAAVTQGKVQVNTASKNIEIPSGSMWSSDNFNTLVPVDRETSSMISSGLFDTVPADKVQEKEEEESRGESTVKQTQNGSGNSSETDGTEIRKEMRERIEQKEMNRDLRRDRRDIIEIKKEQWKENRRRNRE